MSKPTYRIATSIFFAGFALGIITLKMLEWGLELIIRAVK